MTEYIKIRSYVSGGITVFLTLLFGLILALITVSLENVRYLTGENYVRTATEAAALAVFGEYNRELYEEYGLFGYGGYGGKDSLELAENIQRNLERALDATSLNNTGMCMDIYRITAPVCSVSQIQGVKDKEVLYRQVEEYVAANAVTDLSQKLLASYRQGDAAADSQSITETLDTTSAYERGEYDEGEQAEERTGEEGDKASSQEDTMPKDKAGGNPLESFCDLLRDGVLNLVCDVKSAADGKGQEKVPDSAAELLKSMLFTGTGDASFPKNGAVKKCALIPYGNIVFSSYVEDKGRATHYGLEYLVCGREEERDCLSGVVNRLMALRIPINFAYVSSDKEFKAESLATAVAIAGLLEIPPLVQAIQQTILLILSVEESLVDITALLQGRSVPLLKSRTTFQMKYGEICSAGKTLFAGKAKAYKHSAGKWVKGHFDYMQYIWLFLLGVSEEALRERTCALIEFDLRERFNRSFTMEQCIYGAKLSVEYSQPLLWRSLYGGDSVQGRFVSLWHRYE